MVLGNAMFAVLLLCDPGSDACASSDEVAFEEPSPYDVPRPDPEPEAEPRTRWRDRSWDGGMHFSLGLSPMSTLHAQGFHPGIRYDIGTGMAWQRGRVRLAIGPEFHILQYFGRKKPGFGVDAMATVSMKHVYARVGAGTASGIPARRDIQDARPMMGGLIGGGFVGRIDEIEGRIGLDYDVRMDTTGRVAQTVIVAMQISFGP